MQRARHHPLARAVFASDEHIGVRRTDPTDQLQHWSHGGGLGDERRAAAASQQFVFRLQPLSFAQGLAQFDLIADDRGETGVVPRFLDEVARPPPHRFDGQFDIGPGRHDHDRQRAVERLNAGEQIESFLARGGVARVIEVHEQDIELALLQRRQHFGRRSDGFCPVTFAFEQQSQSLQHIGLVVGNQDARGGIGGFHLTRR